MNPQCNGVSRRGYCCQLDLGHVGDCRNGRWTWPYADGYPVPLDSKLRRQVPRSVVYRYIITAVVSASTATCLAERAAYDQWTPDTAGVVAAIFGLTVVFGVIHAVADQCAIILARNLR